MEARPTNSNSTAATNDPNEHGAGAAGGLLDRVVLDDLIRVVNHPRHDEWLAQVRRIGGCSHPLHLAGYTLRTDPTGRVVERFTSSDRPGGVILVPCRNRRAMVCPACASVYHGDTFHLVRAGLLGGKGVPESVSTHPRIFLTLTAPSFGAVHTARVRADGRPAPCHPRRTGECEHGRPTSCRARHPEDAGIVGAPLCPDCYDYIGAVIWQASLGALWHRFTVYLPRQLARAHGITQAALRRQVRLSYVKIAEYQRRGLVHVHAIVRADGAPAPGTDPTLDALSSPPGWVSPVLLEQAARSAAAAVSVRVDGGKLGSRLLRWGECLDVQDVTEVAGGDARARKVALYVAKYATKGTEITGWTGRTGADGTPCAVHAERMVSTALELAAVPELVHLKLGRWAKHLAYRGHVASKSRRYSTTMGALRAARAAHSRTQRGESDEDRSGVTVRSSWRVAGHGYTPGEAVLAAEIARDRSAVREASREDRTAAPGNEVGE
jgi:hypothetical protein